MRKVRFYLLWDLGKFVMCFMLFVLGFGFERDMVGFWVVLVGWVFSGCLCRIEKSK